MPLIVADCPRCKAEQMTFDVLSGVNAGTQYGWQNHYELYCKCRRCFRASVLNVSVRNAEYDQLVGELEKVLKIELSLNDLLSVDGYISLKDFIASSPPQYMPANVEAAFKEGASCLAIGCYNASGAMFRLAIDLATKALLPADQDGSSGGPNRSERKQLRERLKYLFSKGLLSADLHQLADCVKDDGNDGAHDGSLTKADAEDLLDFATELFKRMFTEPERVRLAKERRDNRVR